MKFHLDLDGRHTQARAHTPVDPSPWGDDVRFAPVPRPGRRREPAVLPVLQQAVAAPAGTPSAAWFTVEAPGATTLVVPVGACVRGDCLAESVHVHGEVLGHVRATRGLLLVAPGARVRGGVEGHGPVVIAGLVQATGGRHAVVAHGRLDLACSARVVGAVCHEVVAIYDGARVTGALRALNRRHRGR